LQLLEALLWSLVGFTAGLLDYSLAAGFGLVASLILAGLLGYDPRLVIGSSAAAQLLCLVASLASHRAVGNIGRAPIAKLLALSVVSSIAGMVAALAIRKLPESLVEVAYGVGLIALSATLTASMAAKPKGSIAAAAYAAAAGAMKAVTGGGYGALIALAQLALGLEARQAVALAAGLKAPLFIVVALSYASWYEVEHVAALAAGGALSAPLAAKLLGRSPPGRMLALVSLIAGATAILRLIAM
jgi:uncharacterized membrane protein YfcA